MIYLLLTVACVLSFGVLFKIAGLHDVDSLGLVTINYIVASIGTGIGLASETGRVATGIDPMFVLLGVTTGLLFVGGFTLLALATRTAGMSLALSVMRVSVVIPFTYSWLYWGEVPTDLQLLGLGIACVAFFLIARAPEVAPRSEFDRALDIAPETASRSSSKGVLHAATSVVQDESDPAAPLQSVSTSRSDFNAGAKSTVGDTGSSRRHGKSLAVLSLVLLFVSGGLTDVSMKTFDEVFVGLNTRWQFMAFVFGTAAVAGLVAMGLTSRFNARIVSRRLLLMAVVLGVVNVASVEFLLRAIEVLNGTFVFPVMNISVMVGGAFMGVIIWHERLSGLNRWGIALAVLALLLMQN